MSLEEFNKWRTEQKELFEIAAKHAPMGISASGKRIVIFDIGAHFGESAEIFRELYPDAIIVCFEPMASVQLTETCQRVDAKQVSMAVSNLDNDCVDFHITEFDQCSSLYPTGAPPQEWGELANHKETVRVPSCSLDNWCKRNNLWPDIMKVDVQGAEADVMSGGVTAISRASVIILEEILVPAYFGAPSLDLSGFTIQAKIYAEDRNQRDLVLTNNHAGIGNGLLDLAGSIRYSQIPLWGCCDPAEIFKPMVKFDRAESCWQKFMGPEVGRPREMTEDGWMPPYECWLFEWSRPATETIEEYRGLWTTIRNLINNDIVDEAWEWFNDNKPTEGWQLRSWNDANERIKTGELPRPTPGAFVTADNCNEQGAEHLSYPRKTTRNRTTDAIREDFIELLILSYCDKLVLTEKSSFGECAWWLGGCRADVRIINCHRCTS